MIFTSEFFDRVLPLLKPIGEEQYKIIKKNLQNKKRKNLLILIKWQK